MSNLCMSQNPGITIYMGTPSDSSNNVYCSPPVSIPFSVYGNALGYLATDSVDIQVYFGDGQDTTVRTPIWQGNYFWQQVDHTYQFSGMYSLQYIATGPDGDSDTLTQYNQIIVSDTCGNASGYVFIDTDGDCIFDAGELPVSGIPVNAALAGQNVAWAYTNQNGFYSLDLGFGNTYEITIGSNTAIYGYSLQCPSSGNYQVSTLPSVDNNFALSCMNGFDLEANLSGWGYRPGMQGYIYTSVNNNFCMPVSGKYKLVLDPILTYVSAATPPDQISGDTLIWNFTNLNNSFYYTYMNNWISVITSTSAVLGDSVCLTMIVEPQAGDMNPLNNIVNNCFEIRNSWDPNMKVADPVGEGPLGNIAPQTELSYTVHFQNTGTAEAYNIFVLDTLDADLDISTFHVVSSSHTMTTDILPGDVLKFTFNNIMLPDSSTNEALSHGYVTYKITPKSQLNDGTELTNKAEIFFDFNPAVITNTTLNTISKIMGVNELNQTGSQLQIYPVPTDKKLFLTLNNVSSIDKLQIVNARGQIVYAKTIISGNTAFINTSAMPSGFYTVRILSGSVTSTKNIVIQH
jgi:uncharacterized repeat protein (TIGR01451 family)